MKEVGVDTLQDHLGDYLKQARKGEPIVITEHGRSVALLIAIEGDGAARQAWELVENGAAHWTGGKPAGSRKRPRAHGKSASSIVLEDRR